MYILECANCHYERSSEGDGRSFTEFCELDDGTPVVEFDESALICSDCIPAVTGVVKWYCHSCGVTHTHTPEQRDRHRDQLRAAQAAQIDAQRR